MKTLNDFLSEDSSLTQKITHKNLEKVKKGFDDSSLKEAHEAYKKVKGEKNQK